MIQLLSLFSPARWRRITSGESYLAEVDGVRFVAIMFVIVQHLHERVLRRTASFYAEVAERPFQTAGAGVVIFFALSGFILYRGLRNSIERHGTLRLHSYFLRRLTRLEPPYVIVMTLLFLYLLLIGYSSPHIRRIHEGPDSLVVAYLASLTYTYCMAFGSLPKINPVAWSLEIEVQFYILAPLLVLLVCQFTSFRRPLVSCLAAVVWAGTISTLAAANPHTLNTVLRFLPAFLGGMAIEELCTNRKGTVKFAQAGLLGDVAGLTSLLLLATVKFAPDVPWESIARILLVMAALWGMLEGSQFRKLLSRPWVSVIGGMCYTIYLIHLPIMEVASNATTRIGVGLPYPVFYLLQCILILPVVLLASFAFYGLVERPCMNKHWPHDLYVYFANYLAAESQPLNPQMPKDSRAGSAEP